MAGDVLVDGQIVDKPGKQIPCDAIISLKKNDVPFVSRGGLKLQKAIEQFGIEISGKTVIDVGASTGGFTDCLLQNHAAFVYAVDVGYGQLDWKLRQDSRIDILERTNIRYIDRSKLHREIDLATIDVSFISLEKVLPVVTSLLKPEGQIIALIKPQFEAGRRDVSKGGVVREPEIHIRVIHNIHQIAFQTGLSTIDLTYSPIKGPAGNIEYLIWLQKGKLNSSGIFTPKIEERIDSVVSEAHISL
jgi:23S rRNA (cytidine1920-2'-O)/16S rRNA (cytidine1409-2'-O)-methyltransferase